MSEDLTRLPLPGEPPGASTSVAVTSPRSEGLGSGGLSGSGRHGRFEPGTVLGHRYRIVAMLGRGGMGEVYLADDFHLEQPVALKFLFQSSKADAERVARLRQEVRVARQVSHPNVCRVHDVGETEGLYFLTMEYIEGEDLAGVIRRVGRLPEERGLDLARQICAGVSAAHARGVLHRDLKPANVMLDADGRARITDFGLAVAADAAAHETAGTPAYMAPEQLAGQTGTVQSDVFALGLLLYELFTGRRAFQAKSVGELRREHEFRSFALPTELVPTLPAAIERVILSCLEADPANRPRSAFAVAAALPGSDPLAAALEAGETPSPDMVAAAGGDAATLRPLPGLLLVGALAAGLFGVLALADRGTLLGALPAGLSAEVLSDRAQRVERVLGAAASAGNRVSGFAIDPAAARGLRSTTGGEPGRSMTTDEVPAVFFWQRLGPRPIVPLDPTARRPGPSDPPLRVPGDTYVRLDLQGRLLEVIAVPSPAPPAAAEVVADVDWTPLFGAAGLQAGRFVPVAPEMPPPFHVDLRHAWREEGTGSTEAGRRVEATSVRGRATSFRVDGPWAGWEARPPAAAGSRADQVVSFVATVVVLPLTLVAGIALARRNLARGRGDRRTAWRLGAFVFTLSMATGWLLAHHVPDVQVELRRLTAATAQALLLASVLGLLYLALEPHARRIWPQVLVSWSRVASGRFRDPVIGRDLLVGALAGVLMTLITLAHYQLPAVVGWPAFRPLAPNLTALLGVRAVAGGLFDHLMAALLNALLGAAGLVLTRLITRRRWAAYALATLFFSFLASREQFETGSIALNLVLGAVLVVIVLGAIFRFGLLAGLAAFFAHFATLRTPSTLDVSRPYFETGLAAAVILLGLGGAGFVMARAREPLLGRWAGE